MTALQSWGRARVYSPPRLLKSKTNETFISVVLEFERRPRGFAQRIELRSWQAQDVDRIDKIQVGVMIKFRGEADAVVMVGAESKVYANPRVTGRIVKIYGGES